MKKLVVLALACSLVLFGCASAARKALVGEWEYLYNDTLGGVNYAVHVLIVFQEDGAYRMDMAIGGGEMTTIAGGEALPTTYAVKGDSLVLTYHSIDGKSKENETKPFILNGDTLEMDGLKYQRVK